MVQLMDLQRGKGMLSCCGPGWLRRTEVPQGAWDCLWEIHFAMTCPSHYSWGHARPQVCSEQQGEVRVGLSGEGPKPQGLLNSGASGEEPWGVGAH